MSSSDDRARAEQEAEDRAGQAARWEVEDECARGFKAEMQAAEGDWGTNAQVWPDRESAEQAGHNLLMRWTGASDTRVITVDEAPNMPTWDEHVAERGLPPLRVQL